MASGITAPVRTDLCVQQCHPLEGGVTKGVGLCVVRWAEGWMCFVVFVVQACRRWTCMIGVSLYRQGSEETPDICACDFVSLCNLSGSKSRVMAVLIPYCASLQCERSRYGTRDTRRIIQFIVWENMYSSCGLFEKIGHQTKLQNIFELVFFFTLALL